MAQPPIELTAIIADNTPHARFLTEDPPPHSSGHFFPPPPASSVPTLAPHDSLGPRTLSIDPTTEIHPPWKRSLHLLLEHPQSSSAAILLHMLVTTLILTSALVTVLETVPSLRGVANNAWFGVETTLVVLFTIEYLARCIAWSATWVGLVKWMTSFFGIIDFLAVMPYYIEIILHQDTSVLFRFSILRMFRLLRVFKPFRYNNTILLTIEVMYVSVRRSQHALLAIGFFVAMILTVFSTLLYFAERGTWDPVLDTFINADGDPSQFASIPAAAWFVLVTITTVGYGEITPRSFLGRLITLPILLFGLLLITLPSFVLGREFSHVWEIMKRRQNERSSASPTRANSPRPHDPDSPTTSYFPLSTRTHAAPTPFLHTAPPTSSYPPSSSHPNLHSSHSPSSHHPSPHSSTPHLNPNSITPQTSTPPPHLLHPSSSFTPSQMDLTNRKLAQNQTELSVQISELRRAVDKQGEVILGLLEIIKGQTMGNGDVGGAGMGIGTGRGRAGEDRKDQ